MPVRNPKELFVRVLSHARYGTERSAAIYKDLSDLAQNQDIQQALSARAFVANQNVEKIDEAFKLIGEKPANVSGRFLDAFLEDFRSELADMQSPEARRLFVLAKANQLSQMRAAEFSSLVAAADVTGHFGVGVLLGSCLADHLALIERTQRFVQSAVETKIAAKATG
jgi:ferritin-like metal-binding protein YciE